MSSITVLTLIPNAGDRLPRCLESVKWADDIFCVVDPKTTDGSDEVARRYSNHVVVHEYLTSFEEQRPWALPQIETEWTLVLDADEWLSDELAARIRALIKNSESKDGYNIRVVSYFFGRRIRYCGWQRDWKLRLFRTRKGHFQNRRVHAEFFLDGTIGRIDEPIYHEPYRTFEEYFFTLQRYTTWGALDAYDRGKRAGILDLTLRPLHRFVRMYIFQQGFRDGYHGVVLCGLSAFSVFTKYAKLWNIQREREKAEG